MSDKFDQNEVTIGEVYRLSVRIDSRLDSMAKDMVGRQEYEADHESLTGEIKGLRQALADERTARQDEDRRIIDSATNAKRWAVNTAIGAGSLLLGVVVFIVSQLPGGPA